MIDVNETLSNKIDDVLRPLGITRSFRSYRALRECIIRICEQEDRLEAVQKEIYEPIADAALQVESHSGRCSPGCEAGMGSQPGRGARDGRVPAHRLPQRGAVLGDGV